MKPFEEILNDIHAIVDTYQGGEYRGLNEMHRNLACAMYYLTRHQVEFNTEWNREYHNYTEEGKTSSAAKERHADQKVPELYACRKILEAAKNISISISHELKSD